MKQRQAALGTDGCYWVSLEVISITLHHSNAHYLPSSSIVLVTQLCLTLCNPMDCSLSDSSVHGIFQARILEWVATPFSRGSSQPRDQTQVSHIAGRSFTAWAREALFFFFSYTFYQTVYSFSFHWFFFSSLFIGWNYSTDVLKY